MCLACYTDAMSELVDDAVRILRSLPDDVQEAVARSIIDYNAAEFDR